MKKIFQLTAFIMLVGISMISCKKDKAETTAQKIQHKWTVVSSVDNYHDASGDDISTTPGDTGDYVNFASDGSVTTLFNGTSNSGSYSIISDTQMTIETETYTIKTLTSTQLVLYAKEDIATGEYEEFTINLKR
jgi:hypothetical protein